MRGLLIQAALEALHVDLIDRMAETRHRLNHPEEVE